MNGDSPSTAESFIPPVRHLLKGVVIPTNHRSSVVSSLSSARDHSSEYDTPATSAVITPAESLVRERTVTLSLKMSGKLDKGKRKRSDVNDQLNEDAVFAQSLQRREYEEALPWSRSKRSRRALVEDSDEEVNECYTKSNLTARDLSNADIPLSKRALQDRLAPFPPPKIPREQSLDDDNSDSLLSRQRVKSSPRTSLPSRPARTRATKILQENNARRVLDSDDSEMSEPSATSSEASIFTSDVDSDDVEVSEEGEENREEDADIPAKSCSEQAADPSTLTTDAGTHSARRGRRRRRPQQTTNRRLHHRHFRHMQFDSRVSSI